MVVKNVGVAVLQHALSTRGIHVAVRAVDKLSAALAETASASIDEWAAGTLRPADADAVPVLC